MTALEDPAEVDATPLGQQVALLTKLLDAASAIESIDKDKRNDFHKYDYASAESYLFACRKELLSRRILILGGLADVSERPRQTRDGESSITTAQIMFKVFDVDTGFALEIPWAGRGEDPMDKGLSKALTNAIKTFLRQQLLLPTGDDPEADTSTDERAASMRGTGGGSSDTANLIDAARGLSDAQLNSILVQFGIAAAKSPFGTFARIPAVAADDVRAALEEAKA